MNNDYLKETKELNKQSAEKAGTSSNAAPNMTNMSYGSTLEETKQQNAQSATNATNSFAAMKNAEATNSSMSNSMNNSVTNNAMNSSTSISNDANVLAKVKQENAKSEMNKGQLK
ncbi:spore protein [Clostridium novyi A str. 4552]|uniref:Spore protein n=1 Tax=Clostridium novyi A str. 4552 TaxID=1444289 RepID=A0A0A0ICZ0_CLONO|nr:hypothetical protein [Clostridium novyi]KGM98408.1 spore protein [Clostridium novyi A str. 4552]